MEDKSQILIPKVFTQSNFGKLRVVVIDGVVYFVAKDVCPRNEKSRLTRAKNYI